MNGEAIIAVSALVTALTQIVKWAGLPDRWGPVVVLILAAIGSAVWAYSAGDFSQRTTFAYVSGWAAIALASAGIFGFTRATAATVTSIRSPSSGAGSEPTSKP